MTEKFVVEQKSLLSMLSSMQPICTKRTTLETTGYILCNVGPKELVLKSTDLEISLQSSYEVKESSLSDTQAFLVNGKRLFDLVRELDGAITFTLSKNQLLLTAGSVRTGGFVLRPCRSYARSTTRSCRQYAHRPRLAVAAQPCHQISPYFWSFQSTVSSLWLFQFPDGSRIRSPFSSRS